MPFVTLSSLFSVYNTDAFSFHTKPLSKSAVLLMLQGGSNMTGTDLYVNKPHCAAAVRP